MKRVALIASFLASLAYFTNSQAMEEEAELSRSRPSVFQHTAVGAIPEELRTGSPITRVVIASFGDVLERLGYRPDSILTIDLPGGVHVKTSSAGGSIDLGENNLIYPEARRAPYCYSTHSPEEVPTGSKAALNGRPSGILYDGGVPISRTYVEGYLWQPAPYDTVFRIAPRLQSLTNGTVVVRLVDFPAEQLRNRLAFIGESLPVASELDVKWLTALYPNWVPTQKFDRFADWVSKGRPPSSEFNSTSSRHQDTLECQLRAVRFWKRCFTTFSISAPEQEELLGQLNSNRKSSRRRTFADIARMAQFFGGIQLPHLPLVDLSDVKVRAQEARESGV